MSTGTVAVGIHLKGHRISYMFGFVFKRFLWYK